MKECMNDVVAFGLNQTEIDLVAMVSIFIFSVIFGCVLLRYLNQDIETKEERQARSNAFLAVDLEAERKRNRNVR